MKKHRYSLTLQIGSLFIIMTSIIGLILIRISYVHVQELLTATAKELSFENSQYIETEFRQKTAPILTALDLLAYSSLVNQNHQPIKDKPWLASLELIFKKYPHLVGVYFADDTGQFTMIRPVFDHQARNFFSAPDNAILFINTTHIDGRDESYFLDDTYTPIHYKIVLDNQFDPRTRPWFKQAENDGKQRLTDPYPFHFLHEMGFTLSRRTPDGHKVVAADFTMKSISQEIQALGFSKNSHVAVFDRQFNVIAQKHLFQNPDPHHTSSENTEYLSVFSPILNRISSQTIYETSSYNGKTWSLTLTPVNLSPNVSLMLAEATPKNDLLANLTTLRNKQFITIGLSLVLCILIVIFVASRIANPLKRLVQLSNNIARFELKRTPYPKSAIREINDLTRSLQLMEHTLHDLLTLLHKTASSTDFTALAKTVTHQAYLVTKAETIILYVLKEGQLTAIANHAIIPFKLDLNQLLDETAWLNSQLHQGELVHLNRADNIIKKYKDIFYNSDIYLFPLLDKNRELVGILNLGYEREVTPSQLDKHAFLRELLGFAQIAKENLDKIEQQKEMMSAFVEIIASAIDSKFSYSGDHCQRVPTLCKWLVQAANDDDHYYPKFKLNKEHWEELKLASWLHDCGKVTTPEYVIDKGTKLETLYDRIHEIRMRFELLKSYEQTNYWKSLYAGESQEVAAQILAKRQNQLDEEFAFVANCNIGSESMNDDDISRLHHIATKTWIRTLDDQLGISWMEKQRAGQSKPLPATEHLLADKPSHLVHWEANMSPAMQWEEPFNLTPGKVRYNRGELYNLSIAEGTLNDEERFIVNDHIVQTISMLKKIPFPTHLSRIPEIAGSHHERMDGHGYPRSLHDQDLSIQSRAMAIADIFEALTSNDRPYQKAKTLRKAIEVMTQMATTGHIDPKLYLLFLERDIFLHYARMFLKHEQLESFDKTEYVKTIKQYIKSRR